MRIIGLINKDSGPGFHRVLMPLLLMEGVDAYITNSVKEEDFEKGCDAIYYNRTISDDILNLRDKYGFKIVVDVDDFWELDVHHIAYKLYQENDFRALQIKHLRAADLVTTTHERLAEQIAKFNPNVIVTPNAIPDHEYFTISRTESERVRLFWQGSITHEKDIELLRNPFKRLDGNRNAVVMAGYTSHEVWDRMTSAFTRGLRIPGMVLPGASPFEYYKNYQHADICLAPLVPSKFNGFKSNLKVLEAAHAKLPIIASEVEPYPNLPVLYAKKQGDWMKHIRALTKNSALRKQQGEQLYIYCREHFNFNKINEFRKDQILKLNQSAA